MSQPIARPNSSAWHKLIPHSETTTKMSSTERHNRAAPMEKKPRATLIDYSQHVFPRSINAVRAWDSSPEQCMETVEKLPEPSLRPQTSLPDEHIKTVLQSTTAWVPTKNNIPFLHLLSFKSSSNPRSGGTFTMCIVVSIQHSSVIASLGSGRRNLHTGEKHCMRDTGRRGKI